MKRKKRIILIIITIFILMTGVLPALGTYSYTSYSTPPKMSLYYGDDSYISYTIDEVLERYINYSPSYIQVDIEYEINQKQYEILENQYSSLENEIDNYNDLKNNYESLAGQYEIEYNTALDGSDEKKKGG